MSKANPHYIDKTKAPPPKFVRTPHPPLFKSGKPNKHGKTFKSQKEEDKYWIDTQFPKWLEGHYVSDHKTEENRITGPHYFYLQEGMLRTLDGYERPYWRDWDDKIFKAWEAAQQEGNDLLIGKRREIGLSSIFAGCIPVYNCLVHQTSDNGMTSADKTRVYDIFENKAKVFMKWLHPYIRLGIEREKQEMIHFSDSNKNQGGEAVKDMQKKVKAVERDFYVDADELEDEENGNVIDSRIICKPTQKDHQAFETSRFIYAFLDEIGLHPMADDVRESLDGCLRKNAKRVGSMALGGTIMDMTQKGAEVMQSMWYSESAGIDTFFIPGYACHEDFMVNGWSYENDAKDYILKRREELRKGKTDADRKAYYNFLKRFPLSVDEMFDAIQDSFWSENIENILKEQQVHVIDVQPNIGVGNLYNDQDQVKWRPDNMNGKFQILERPLPNVKNLYVAGIDPISYTESEKGSNLACVVFKRSMKGQDYSNLPVAIYENREHSTTMAEDLINLLRYYNNAPALLEKQYGEAIMKEFDNYNWVENGQPKNATQELLSWRLKTLGIKYTNKSKEVGQWVNGWVADRFNELAGYFIEHYGRNIYFLDLLKGIANMSNDKNKRPPDLFSAFRLGASLFWEMYNLDVKQKKSNKKTYRYSTIEVVNGVPKRKTKYITKEVKQ